MPGVGGLKDLAGGGQGPGVLAGAVLGEIEPYTETDGIHTLNIGKFRAHNLNIHLLFEAK